VRDAIDNVMRRVSPYERITINVLRIVTGFLFLQHGVQKLFGWLGGEAAELASIRGLAGVLEAFGGALILLGFAVRPVALVLFAEMAIAYAWRHAPRGFWPIENGGERAALYAAVFLYLTARGGGGFGIDGLRGRRRPGPGRRGGRRV